MIIVFDEYIILCKFGDVSSVSCPHMPNQPQFLSSAKNTETNSQARKILIAVEGKVHCHGGRADRPRGGRCPGVRVVVPFQGCRSYGS